MIPHDVPSHVARPFAGFAHGVHAAPQLAVLVFATHMPLHRWNPALQTKPHVGIAPAHVAVAFAGAGHGLHDAPHELTLVLLAQADPHW